jgi:penicillin amidase
MRRLAVRTLGSVAVLTALAILFGYLYLRRSLPELTGSISVAGLSAPVDIVRDGDAVTHVFASTKLDALYGLGYAHAQDRLWQMEFQRRVGHGLLSEIFGTATIQRDRFLRTIGFGRAARAAWNTLPDDSKRQIDGYVRGVNAFLERHHGGALPPEFTLLRFEPAPWTGVDVLVWAKMIAWDLSKNYTFELFRQDVVGRLGAGKLADLMPPYPADGLSIVTEGGAAWPRPSAGVSPPSAATMSENTASGGWSNAFTEGLLAGGPIARDILARGTNEALGSNNWAIGGDRTTTGRPMLANDPHFAAQIPSIWYLAHLSAGDFDVIGATLPGIPVVAIGRNRSVAWGETNLAADVEDLFRERLDPTGRAAEFRGVMEPLRVVSERIIVKGGPSVLVDVRISRHGPLVSDAINANNAESSLEPKPALLEPLAFRWTALDAEDTTVAAFLKLNESRNWGDFTTALRGFVVPPQNFVYADVEGHVGYYGAGRIPMREGRQGERPADGWPGVSEWAGWVPFDELPHSFDPPEHLIVTANNRPAPLGHASLPGSEWTEPFRAQRIRDLIAQKARLGPDDFAAIQADTFSPHARSLLPVLLSKVRPVDSRDAQAIAVLKQWDFDANRKSQAAAIFQAWLVELTPAIVGDELGPQLTDNYMGLDRSSFVARFLLQTLSAADNPWCDDVRTPGRETCTDVVSSALHAAVARLTKSLGDDLSRWRWDAVHVAVFPHLGLDAVTWLRPMLSRSMPHGGDWSTVNVGPVFAPRPFEQRSVPGYRQIVDLSPANDSRFLDAVGQSGHPLSNRYDDSLREWAKVGYKPMRMNREDIERGAIGHLRLEPQ